MSATSQPRVRISWSCFGSPGSLETGQSNSGRMQKAGFSAAQERQAHEEAFRVRGRRDETRALRKKYSDEMLATSPLSRLESEGSA